MTDSNTENLKGSENGQTDNLRPLLDKIINEAGLADLPQQDLQSIRESLGLQINRRLGLIVMNNLDDKALDEYKELFGDDAIPDPDKLEPFLEKNIPDYKDKIKAGLDDFAQAAVAKLKG